MVVDLKGRREGERVEWEKVEIVSEKS